MVGFHKPKKWNSYLMPLRQPPLGGADFRSGKVQTLYLAAITTHGVHIFVYFIHLFILLCGLRGQRVGLHNFWY